MLANVRVGNYGVIYCSHESSKSLTTPFIFTSVPLANETEALVWPEAWRMPFSIHPLGTPRKQWKANEAAAKLPFNKGTGNSNIASVFKAVGTAVFSPPEIGEDDWSMIVGILGDERLI